MTILILIVATIIAGYFLNKYYIRPHEELAKIYRALSGVGIPKTEANFKYDTFTPKGVPVKSVVPVPSDALNLIDAGISLTIARYKAVFTNWDKGFTFPEYQVLFVEPRGVTVENDPGAPLIFANGVSAAGTTLMGELSPVKNPIIVLPHQEKQQWSHNEFLMNSAQYEAEHTIEFLNRKSEPVDFYKKFGTTTPFSNDPDVGVGDVHPHQIP